MFGMYMNIMYSTHGHIIFVKSVTKSKIPKVIVTYWKTDEAAEDGRMFQLQYMGY